MYNNNQLIKQMNKEIIDKTLVYTILFAHYNLWLQ